MIAPKTSGRNRAMTGTPDTDSRGGRALPPITRRRDKERITTMKRMMAVLSLASVLAGAMAFPAPAQEKTGKMDDKMKMGTMHHKMPMKKRMHSSMRMKKKM